MLFLFLWWNTSWKFRMPLYIKTDTIYHDVVVKVSLDYFPFHLYHPDGNELRVVHHNKLLPFWRERWEENGIRVWIKMDTLKPVDTIYFYYGNPDAEDVSDQNAILVFYDDFEDEDVSDWVVGNNSPEIEPAVEDGRRVIKIYADRNWEWVYRRLAVLVPFTVEFDLKWASGSIGLMLRRDGECTTGYRDAEIYGDCYAHYVSFNGYSNYPGQHPATPWKDSLWHHVKFEVDITEIRIFVDDSLARTWNGPSLDDICLNQICVEAHRNCGNGIGFFDNIKVIPSPISCTITPGEEEFLLPFVIFPDTFFFISPGDTIEYSFLVLSDTTDPIRVNFETSHTSSGWKDTILLEDTDFDGRPDGGTFEDSLYVPVRIYSPLEEGVDTFYLAGFLDDKSDTAMVFIYSTASKFSISTPETLYSAEVNEGVDVPLILSVPLITSDVSLRLEGNLSGWELSPGEGVEVEDSMFVVRMVNGVDTVYLHFTPPYEGIVAPSLTLDCIASLLSPSYLMDTCRIKLTAWGEVQIHNYPNPFSEKTTFVFYLPDLMPVDLTVYTRDGRKVITLIHGEMGKGMHTVEWDGTNAAGRKIAPGVYLYILKAGGRKIIKKAVRLP